MGDVTDLLGSSRVTQVCSCLDPFLQDEPCLKSGKYLKCKIANQD